MMKTFPSGGIHPPQNKITASKPVISLPIPDNVVIPVAQHTGKPAKVIVKSGDYVKTGQLLAMNDGVFSSNIHSSVSGIINKIDLITDSTGYKQPAVFIDTAGDEWVDTIDRSDKTEADIRYNQSEIIKRIQESGIVGMGGAAFPSHIKLSVPSGKKCEILIINGVECEPYLTADHRLMLEKGEEILVGIRILMKALNVEKAMIGIENNKNDAIDHLENLARGYDGITVHPLKVKYPQGGEKQLIKALLGKEVPGGYLPVDVGAVVHNVATVFAVYEAVQKNKPLFERVVTISGKSLKNPGNFLVRIGTPIGKLIDAAGGFPPDTGKISVGGPMMGKVVINTEVPVTKSTSGVILYPESESLRPEIQPCIRCGKCINACGLELEPYLLMKIAEKGLFDRLEDERVTDCMECGSCSYVCPSNRPILDYIRLGKSKVAEMKKTKINKA